MRDALLRFIWCPACHDDLSVVGTLHEGGEITAGELRCAADHRFPVRNGIPRFVDDGASSPKTQACYTHLWRYRQRAVGWGRLDETRAFVLERLGLQPSSPGVFVDVGCGDGQAVAAAAAAGFEAIGLDLSRGVEIGRAASAAAHWIQGDCLRLPLRPAIADYVWSYGVLHHTADPARAFAGAVGLCKPAGRVFLWLYDRAPRPAIIRWTQRAPLAVKRAVSATMMLGNRAKRAIGRANVVTATQGAAEVYLWNLDMYGPEYRSLHPEPEARAWLEAAGFAVTQKDRIAYGYGLLGVR